MHAEARGDRPASTRVVRRAARPLGAGAIQEQVEQLIARRQEQSPARVAGTGDRRNGAGPRDLLGLLVAAWDSDGSTLSRQEIRDEIATFLAKLPWTTAVISEAMRLYPPAWTLERTALADDDVCGTPVPAGSMVAVLPYLVHRNPLDLACPGLPRPRGFVMLRPAGPVTVHLTRRD